MNFIEPLCTGGWWSWRELNPRPHLAPCGSQGIGAKSVRFFIPHTTRQDTNSPLCSFSPVALLPKIEPCKHAVLGFLHHFATLQTPLAHRKIAHDCDHPPLPCRGHLRRRHPDHQML